MKLQSVIFDFDGVIIDTEKARYDAMQEIFSTFGQVLPLDIWVQSIGKASYVVHPYDLLEKLVGHKVETDKLNILHKKIEMQMADSMPLLPGVADRIQEIKELGGKIAVASSSSRAWVEGHLKKRNLFKFFDATVCREDTCLHKPNPEPYLTALKLLNAQAAYSFAVEDSPTGIEAALSAGLRCIAVGGSLTKNMDLTRAYLRTESLEQISFVKMIAEQKFAAHEFKT